jgi:HSP20 family protein|tara:strand:+ start:1774 stop:2286 length:513 start_codon:yes stop_codon:yes gene_type:complete
MNYKNDKITENVDGILHGLGDLVGKLKDLAETGEKIKRNGVFEVNTGSEDKATAVYGFSVKMGLNDDDPEVEPFGNVRRDAETGVTTVREVHEPLIDVIAEHDHVLVLAEMPGISAADVGIELNGDVLTIKAACGRKKYHKEVVLPRSFDTSGMSFSCRNGILEVKLSDL